MPIILDHQLREQIAQDAGGFPVRYFSGELASYPNREGPLHWHPGFEIAAAVSAPLELQIGQQHITLNAGNSIFINGNVLHGARQLSGDAPDPMPNIVFSGAVIAPEASAIHQKYIQPLFCCAKLPFILFDQKSGWHAEVKRAVREAYRLMSEQGPCYEMAVQRALGRILEAIFSHFDALPKSENAQIQLNTQIRFQKMLAYIRRHYAEAVTLEEIAGAAHISRSEAGRCFHTYMGCSPVDALIRYRLQAAHCLMKDRTLTLRQIGSACGFHSVQYFSRQFRRVYGCTPGEYRAMGK